MTAEHIVDAAWVAAAALGLAGTIRHMWRTRHRPTLPEPRSHVRTHVPRKPRITMHNPAQSTVCERPHLEVIAGGDEWDLAVERHRAAQEAARTWHPSQGRRP